METEHNTDALLDALGNVQTYGRQPQEALTALTDDSRAVIPGSVFVAVRGVETDGHRYIPSAAHQGASVIIAEDIPANKTDDVFFIKVSDSRKALALAASRWYGDPSEELSLVGVTGTNGKTTVATLLYETARLLGHKAGLLSTVANIIDGVSEPADHTTPHPLKLNALLRRMADAGCTFAAMEVSSHAADQSRICGLDFDGAVFTNLTRDHLDYHKTFDNYLHAKKSFFDALKPEAFALVNADDRNGAVMLQNTAARRKAYYSVRTSADYCVKVIENRLDGMLLEFDGTAVEVPFVGRFNASNLAAVYGACLLSGCRRDTLLPALSALRPVAGRFQPFRSADGVTAIVDYAHTPDALINVLDTIDEAACKDAAIWCVVGAGGDRDRGKRPQMARAAYDRCHHLVLTSDNPRHEEPEAIADEMLAGLSAEEQRNTAVILDRRQAIAYAVDEAKPGDVVLVAGKGHETYQITGDRSEHFDDREEVTAALRRRDLRNSTHKDTI